jgi:hypothetical protein
MERMPDGMRRQEEPARWFPTSPQLWRVFSGQSNRDQKKTGPIGPEATVLMIEQTLKLLQIGHAASSGSLVAHGPDGSIFSIVPLPIVRPIKITVIVPPANRANSESWRPQSAPAIPSPKRATMEPICPRNDQGVDRGMSRLRQRPMIPQTWNKTTKTSKTAQMLTGTSKTIQAPSVVPAWDTPK